MSHYAFEVWNRSYYGARLVLWTCRGGEWLKIATDWFDKNGIELDGINDHCLGNKTGLSVKIDTDYFIDDKSIGIPHLENGCVDWLKVMQIIEKDIIK